MARDVTTLTFDVVGNLSGEVLDSAGDDYVAVGMAEDGKVTFYAGTLGIRIPTLSAAMGLVSRWLADLLPEAASEHPEQTLQTLEIFGKIASHYAGENK